MTQDVVRQSLIQIVSNIRAAETLLLQASRATIDPVKLMRISTEYQALDSYLSQVLHAQATVDDQQFQLSVVALKQQAGLLQQEANHVKAIIDDVAIAAQIIDDVAIAAQIIDFVAEALAFIATL